MNGTVIEDGAVVRYSILDENVTIGKNAVVGESRERADGIAVVGAGVKIPSEKAIPAGSMISEM
jgi:NDP-sugar pyrophosphorylase family protein